MFKGQDFVLDHNLLEKDFQLVEVADWVDFNSREKLGTNYTVLYYYPNVDLKKSIVLMLIARKIEVATLVKTLVKT
jgi:hypothetical protein